MIRKGMILAVLTMLFSLLIFGCLYYGECLIKEFRFTERAETMQISDTDTYDPHDTGGIYLRFRYIAPDSGKEYTSPPIFTYDTSLRPGDSVEVITRNGCPKMLASSTKRGRARTVLERAADVGYESIMFEHIGIILGLLLLFGIPCRRWIPEEIQKRKRFFIIITSVFGIISAVSCLMWMTAMHVDTWESLGLAFISILVYMAGAAVLLISWLVNSVILRRREKRQA